MNNITESFARGKRFVGYMTVGEGGLDYSLQSALALIAGGVDVLELGVPFSDPIADGPVIQHAMQRALQMNTSINDVLKFAEKLRQHTDIPLILFSYYNPILAAEKNNFYQHAKQSGIDGMLIVDLPYEEAADHLQKCKTYDIAPILLLVPSSTVDRIQTMNKAGNGFLYYVCRKGTTGVKNNLPADYAEKILTIKNNVTLPVVVGFGISNAAMAQDVLEYADGFVVGSAFVQAMANKASATELTAMAKQLDPR